MHRVEGATTGSQTFLVDRPWYSATRFASVGLAFDYGYKPLDTTGPTLTHGVVGQVSLAGSLFDRVRLAASLPVSLFEQGTADELARFAPLDVPGLGDPRVGLMVRVVGQADKDPISLHVGFDGWIPVGVAGRHQGDVGPRLLPHATLAGAAGVFRWTVDGAFLYRPYASLGPSAQGVIAASEARAQVAVGVSLLDDRLWLGPEAQFSTQVAGASGWRPAGMNVELLGGVQYLIGDQVQIGAAGGVGLLNAPGTADVRAMVRIAWAPQKRAPKPTGPTEPVFDPLDPDADGIQTVADRCPYEPETKNGVRDEDGCPELFLEQTAQLARVLAPKEAAIALGPDAGLPPPPPVRPTPIAVVDAGAPAPVAVVDAGAPPAPVVSAEPVDAGVDPAVAFVRMDSDSDGVPDDADRCPVRPEDPDGFEDEDGCGEPDDDFDGVADANDKCPSEAETLNGIDDLDGCPDLAPDADLDGVADLVDRCPFEPESDNGLRDEDGCPEFVAPELAALPAVLEPRAPEVIRAAAPVAVPPEAPVTPAPAPPAGSPAPAPVEVALGAPPPPMDSDKDGVADEEDRCPVQPEDADGFEDEDGCGEPDDDFDGIADGQDKCPAAAEVFNGYKDDDGCPDEDPDVDADGFHYADDRCPFEKGTTPDGCPHLPAPALALPGFTLPQPFEQPIAAPSGETPAPAPAPVPPPPAAVIAKADLDKDTVPDVEDPCPASPEDKDGFEDGDGCAEPDNDADGIEDKLDKCPYEAEVINGVKDDDGCPDLGASAVAVTEKAVVITGVIQFKVGSAALDPKSLPLVKQVASTLKANKTISVEIQGHTDDLGSAAANVKLSQKRAETIRDVLVKAGVKSGRLIPHGYGPTKPRATNKTKAGRDLNRRVEFLILGEQT